VERTHSHHVTSLPKTFFFPNIKSASNYFFVLHPCICKILKWTLNPRNVEEFNNQLENKERHGSEWTQFSLPKTSSRRAGVASWKPKALSQTSTKVLLYFSSSAAASFLSSSCHLWHIFVQHGWINISWIPCLCITLFFGELFILLLKSFEVSSTRSSLD
jgi:hypothetical protein